MHLAPSAPEDACTVDVTPRHCRKFKPKAGRKFKWTNTPLSGQAKADSGTVIADRWGLVTLPQVAVTKAKNRLVISAQ